MRLEGQEQGKRIAEQGKNIDRILLAIEKDGENIRSLARIAEAHEHRLSDLEGGNSAT